MPESGDIAGTDPAQSAAEISAASMFSAALLDGLVAAGVREFVVCPGSRSQALALEAAALEASGRARVHVRIDERSGAFLALGLAVESGMPAAIITTSGTATANLFPAVLEAHHAGVPMLLLTADRPDELLGTGSNQTTRQAGLYGFAAHASFDIAAPSGQPGEIESAHVLAADVVDAAVGTFSADPGPVHVNVAFREPLSSRGSSPSRPGVEDRSSGCRQARPSDVGSGSRQARPSEGAAEVLQPGPRTVVIAGHNAGEAAEQLARDADWPLLAEVSSGARFGPNLVVAYRELLSDHDFGGRVERAIVFGHPTLSREVPALLTRDDVEVIVVAPTGSEPFNPAHRATIVAAVALQPETSYSSREWRGRWVHVSRQLLQASTDERADRVAPNVAAGRSFTPADRLAFVRTELDAIRAPITRRMLVETVWRFTWPHDRLVLGASRLIREADRVVPGRRIRVHSNRGLSGIDGTIATATGVALASQAAADADNNDDDDDADTGAGIGAGIDAAKQRLGVTRALIGDLTLLHDVGSLLLGSGERHPHVQIVVGNDGGGSIFDTLEAASTSDADVFDRVMFTPHAVDIAALASAYGWSYSRATTRGELDQALSAPPAGVSVVEVPLER